MVTSVPPTTLASWYSVGRAMPRVKGVSGIAWKTQVISFETFPDVCVAQM